MSETEQNEPLGIRYIRADVTTSTALGNAEFDAATCNFGLSDIDALDAAIAAVSRALRPHGSFTFSILHPCFAGGKDISASWPATGRYYDEGHWTAHEARSGLRRLVGANHRMLSTYGLADTGINAYDADVSSTNPTVEIDHSSLVPLHEQVAAAIRRAIADGEAGPGERLPPARDLAAVLGVNANTVFRALRTLREEKLVEFRRGRGVSVTGTGPQRSAVVTKARELVAMARRYGYRPEELTAIIEQVSVELS